MDTNRIVLIIVALAVVAVLAWYIYPMVMTAPGTGTTATSPVKTVPTEPKK